MIYVSKYSGEEIDNRISQIENIYNSTELILCLQYSYTSQTVDNPEFVKIILDQNDRVIAGLRVNGTVLINKLN